VNANRNNQRKRVICLTPRQIKRGEETRNEQRSKGGEGDRRAVRIIYIHSKARQISQRDETNQETGVGDGVMGK
jgi:hypothetical protein